MFRLFDFDLNTKEFLPLRKDHSVLDPYWSSYYSVYSYLPMEAYENIYKSSKEKDGWHVS